MRIFFGLLLVTAMSLTEVYAQNTAISSYTFNMGFAEAASATTNAQSVAGQLVVGSAQSATTAIESGFLPGASAPSPDTVAFTITTVSDTGVGSLRWAMQASNDTAGLNLINFNIPGSGVHTITPASPLPTFTDQVIIDGYTQPGASPNTNPPELGSNAVLLIELNGINAGGGGDGRLLGFETIGSTVRGLVINRCPSTGITLRRGGNNVIEGNFIGTNPSGTVALGNSYGITIDLFDTTDRIGGTFPAARNVISGNLGGGIAFGGNYEQGGSHHVIQGNLIGTNAAGTVPLGNSIGVHFSYNTNSILVGGTIPAARNIISGNANAGISFSSGFGSPLVSRNLVQGNFIGTDVSGTAAIGNSNSGVTIYGLNNTIGGTVPGAGNIISGNGGYGVVIQAGDGSTVQGNYIGTDVNGPSPLGNKYIGVYVVSRNVRVGGTEPGAGNIIAFNGTTPLSSAGVAILGTISTRNAILGNSIFSNVGLGIDLVSRFGDYGVTPNDSCDADTLQSNNFQNYPVLNSALPSGGNMIVQGTLNSAPNNIFRIEFFSSPTPDSTGYGEGKTFLGFTNVITGDNCLASFVDTLMSIVPLGYYISATATDTGNNTSEFSRNLAVGTTTSVQDQGIELPTRYALEQNYPNPFNPATFIWYLLPASGHVTLKIYDMIGQEVATLIDGEQEAGYQSVEWNVPQSGIASGVYFYRMTAGPFTEMRKLMLLK
ncbi:MAG: T9SS type A sorting domain-containing protein [Ignavibacteria bacterium]|nr:T9SS type A sorting domain-containing protein [Ignavibacteria bacterium]